MASLALAGLQTVGPASRAAAPVPAGPAVEFAELPGGTFMMGCVPGDNDCQADEHPRHAVQLTRGVAMMRTEVTVGHYEAFARATGRTTPRQPRWSKRPDYPAVNLTWEEARDVCAGLGGRLPTEAEWEYSARGGLDGQVFPWGQDPDPAQVNAQGVHRPDTWPWAAPVGSFPPNEYGLYDVSGNVWEWVADWYAPQLDGAASRDPRGPSTGERKVLRGGSWDSRWPRLRVSVRQSLPPGARYNLYVGVRCARDRNRRPARR